MPFPRVTGARRGRPAFAGHDGQGGPDAPRMMRLFPDGRSGLTYDGQSGDGQSGAVTTSLHDPAG